MWIKYALFKNFQNFKTGLKANEVEIDFSKRENQICLIVGPNGIGKTSIMSCLTPFATLGNLDVREATQLVIEGKNGYKKIVIMDGLDEYIIQHYYTATKETHSVKSYIMLNEKELNPNGNVTSFKELVYELLDVDIDYLKLIRLGTNVTNLIDMKTTDRKNYMAKFLDSVDIYLKYYKKKGEDIKDIKAVISHTVDKIKRLDIEDVEVYKEQTKSLQKNIDLIMKDIKNQEKIIATSEYKIKELEIPDNIKDQLQVLGKDIKKCSKILDKVYTKEEIDSLKKEKEEKENLASMLIGELNGIDVVLKNDMNLLDTTFSELQKIIKDLEVEKSKSNVDSLKSLMETLNRKRVGIEKTLTTFTYYITKDEFDKFVVVIKNIQRTLNMTYEFGKEPIKEALKILKNNGAIQEYVASHMVAIEKEKKHNEKTYLDKLIDKYHTASIPKCGQECALKKLYDDMMIVKKMKPSVEIVQKSPEYYQMVNVVYDNIKYCLAELEEYIPIIKKLPDNIQPEFSRKAIFDHIKKCEYIYNEEKINYIMTELTELSNYDDVMNDIEETSKKIEIEEKTSMVNYLQKSIKMTKNKVEEIKANISDSKEESNDKKNELLNINSRISDIDDIIFAVTSYNEVKDRYDNLSDRSNKEKDILNERMISVRTLEKRNNDYHYIENIINQREHNLKEYSTLMKELLRTKELYDDLMLIRSSLSNKDGIPLAFIEFYLKNIKDVANDLLDIVYHGELYLDVFVLSANDFKIPYVKNGRKISDIIYASQGEKGFLGTAISFAISSENMTKYNIPLLDEVDAPFDVYNRERFIDVIDKQFEINTVEQAFIISHNNMFDQYPVDVLNVGNIESNTNISIKLK